jgi:hypothetical protein
MTRSAEDSLAAQLGIGQVDASELMQVLGRHLPHGFYASDRDFVLRRTQNSEIALTLSYDRDSLMGRFTWSRSDH